MPSGPNAWAIGEAAGFLDADVRPLFEPASGLLGLLWFEHVDDFIGVVGCTDVKRLLEDFEARFMAMLRSANATMHQSPYDALPVDHEVLVHEARPEMLQQIAETRVINIPDNLDCRRESTAINERRVALKIWNMPPEMRTIMREAASRWFDDPGLCREVRETKVFPSRSRALRRAFVIARSNMAPSDVLDLMVDHLSQWVYAAVKVEPPMESIQSLMELVANPNAKTSYEILSAYRTFGYLDRFDEGEPNEP